MIRNVFLSMLIVFLGLSVVACSSTTDVSQTVLESQNLEKKSTDYLIGPGDTLEIYVWQNPDISTTVQVRPDGKISTPLVEDLVAIGKTPSNLARDIEVALKVYIRKPVVNVIVSNFVGHLGEQIRVVGQAANPQALPYREGITLLDVLIEVGGLTEFASGNRAKIVRKQGAESVEMKVRLHDLLNKGKVSENVSMKPGDILIIPESIF